MRHYTKLLLLTVAAMLLGQPQAQADELTKYKAFADTIKAYVWGMDLPQFKRVDLPKKYNNRSAVIVASYRDLNIVQKSMLNVGSVLNLSFTVDRDVICKDIERTCIHINDQSALKKYTEFDFKTFYKRRNHGWKEKARHVLGVRVIKPDSSVREVSTEDYVDVAEGKGDKDKSQKLAVPGLAIGDNIDFFTYEELKLEEHSLDPFVINYQDEYPILWKKIHCSIDPDLTVQYRTLNGAPDFVASFDKEKNIVLDALVENVEKTDPDLWFSPAEQSPLTVINVIGRRLKGEFIPQSTKKKGLQANPDVEEIQNDSWQKYTKTTYGQYYQSLRKACKNANTKYPDIAERADYVYDLLRQSYLADRVTNAWVDYFTYNFSTCLAFAGINNSQVVIATEKGSEPVDKMTSYGSAITLTYVKDANKYYAWTPAPIVAGELPFELQGRKAIVRKGKVSKNESLYDQRTLPESKAADNQYIYTLKATMDNGTDIVFSHEEKATGTIKQLLAPAIVTLKDMYDSYRDRIPDQKDFTETLGNKKAKAEQQQVEKDKEKQQDGMKRLVENYWGSKPKDIKDCRLVSVGTAKGSPAVAFHASYAMEGLVKKAGPNLILSTGRLLGDLMKVEGTDRQRDADINMLSARQTVWDIEVTLPAGYKVSPESLQQLDKNVSNDCGAFVAKATSENGKLMLHVTKTYSKGYLPASKWTELLSIIDASNDYTTLQTVLKK